MHRAILFGGVSWGNGQCNDPALDRIHPGDDGLGEILSTAQHRALRESLC
jgi:hypothetical protein